MCNLLYESSQILILIMVYFDDFEISNALCSHIFQLKFGGINIKMLALPDHLNSKFAGLSTLKQLRPSVCPNEIFNITFNTIKSTAAQILRIKL